jgi:hypothetical protein
MEGRPLSRLLTRIPCRLRLASVWLRLAPVQSSRGMNIYEEIARLQREGGRGAVATIVNSSGSVPSLQRAKMLIRDDGSSPARDQSVIAHWGLLSGATNSALA